MAASDDQFNRVALITAVVSAAPRAVGRTSLMKCLYFLQTLKAVPLGYDFTLYTYGPFESDVLNDLKLAERIGAVESQLFQFTGGYGYELRPGIASKAIMERAKDFIAQYREGIDWIIEKFGNRSAQDLEIASTLIYIDRSSSEKGERLSINEMINRVHEIKPHLKFAAIEAEAESLKKMRLFVSEH